MSKKEQNFETNINNAKEQLEKLNDPEISLEDSVKVYKDGLGELEKATKLLEDAKLVFEEKTKQ
jgi:exodeoxyribonuclease VII small subunit